MHFLHILFTYSFDEDRIIFSPKVLGIETIRQKYRYLEYIVVSHLC